MIIYTTGDLLKSSAETLVNTVNCEGYMGKGIAYQFKLKFPENNKDYVKACKTGELQIGKLHYYKEDGKIIVNFPTKNKWRAKSYKNNPNSHKAMLDQEKASAFFAPWKLKINNIQKGDRVFLYKSGTGIVATGIGTGELKTATYEGKEDEEFYTPLDSFKILKTPLKAAKIKEAANSNFVFNQTMFRINKTKGDLILGYMEEHCF